MPLNVPKMPQNVPKMPQNVPKMPPKCPKMSPSCPTMSPSRPKMSPNCPKKSSSCPKMSPNCPKISPYTDTQVQSELLRGLWGGHSHTFGTPPHTPTPRYNQSSLGVSGVGIPVFGHSTQDTDTQVQSELLRGLWCGHSQLLALQPIHRHPGTIRVP